MDTLLYVLLYCILVYVSLCFVDPVFSYSVEDGVPDFDDLLPYGQFSLDER